MILVRHSKMQAQIAIAGVQNAGLNCKLRLSYYFVF
ncbi:MAG: hypothetical protein ACJAWH_000799 [Maribacter sp.]|jgi:hypothetical protein